MLRYCVYNYPNTRVSVIHKPTAVRDESIQLYCIAVTILPDMFGRVTEMAAENKCSTWSTQSKEMFGQLKRFRNDSWCLGT